MDIYAGINTSGVIPSSIQYKWCQNLLQNDQTKPVELKCSVQNYDWGIKGEASLVGKFME